MSTETFKDKAVIVTGASAGSGLAKLVAPGLLDRFTMEIFLKSAARRVKQAQGSK